MKRILLLSFAILSLALSASAQRATLFPLIVGDTVNNTGAVSKVMSATAGYAGFAVQPVVTKISGTVAGTAILSYSLDGVNYTNTDTLNLANNATNSVVWAKTHSPAVFYKVTVTGTGTMSAQFRLWYVGKIPARQN